MYKPYTNKLRLSILMHISVTLHITRACMPTRISIAGDHARLWTPITKRTTKAQTFVAAKLTISAHPASGGASVLVQ